MRGDEKSMRRATIASVILAQNGSGLDGCDAERLQAKSIATAGNDDEGGGNDEGDSVARTSVQLRYLMGVR